MQATSSILPDYIVSSVASAVGAATNNALVDVADTAFSAVAAPGGAVGDVSGVEGTFVEWARGILRKEWRIQCLDLIIRL